MYIFDFFVFLFFSRSLFDNLCGDGATNIKKKGGGGGGGGGAFCFVLFAPV
eukprot:COSAG06_NODE_65073_length_258_cov_0.515723_1_plen_50_part_01